MKVALKLANIYLKNRRGQKLPYWAKRLKQIFFNECRKIGAKRKETLKIALKIREKLKNSSTNSEETLFKRGRNSQYWAIILKADPFYYVENSR